MTAVRRVIKKWLDDTPAFTASYVGGYLLVSDTTSRDNLAVIVFNDDHLIVHLPQRDLGSWFRGSSQLFTIGSSFFDRELGCKLLYCDPGLHERVKRLVHRAYQ